MTFICILSRLFVGTGFEPVRPVGWVEISLPLREGLKESENIDRLKAENCPS
jgi:hypothetical protein